MDTFAIGADRNVRVMNTAEHINDKFVAEAVFTEMEESVEI
jgi:hypothetical protein